MSGRRECFPSQSALFPSFEYYSFCSAHTFLIGGDINNLALQPIIDSLENMKQVVETPTHRNRVLDIILTNMKENYYPPFVRDPIECDLPGEPSDHKIVIFLPKTVSNSQMLPSRKSIKSRPITQLGINEFGRFLTAHNWYEILLSLIHI